LKLSVCERCEAKNNSLLYALLYAVVMLHVRCDAGYEVIIAGAEI
jgi:hypothetical protein